MLYGSAAVFSEDNLVASLNLRLKQGAVIAIFASAYSQNLALLRFFLYCGIRQKNE